MAQAVSNGANVHLVCKFAPRYLNLSGAGGWCGVHCAVENVTVGGSGSVTDTVTVSPGLPGATNDERQLN